MVFRRRNSMALRPVNRIKHVIDSVNSVTANTQIDIPIVSATDTPSLAVTTSVQTGSKVNGVYFRVAVASDQMVPNAIPNCYLAIWKNPGSNLASIPVNTVGSNDNKRFVIHQEMRMLQNEDGGNPIVLYDGVVALPRGYRRFGPNDELTLSFVCGFLDTKVCIQAHYKEFR